MSKTNETNNLKALYADLGTAYVNKLSHHYEGRFSPAERAAVRTLRFDCGSLCGSTYFRKGEILYLKEGGFVRIALIEESWDEPSHEDFQLEYRLIHCLPVIPEERLERHGGACRLAPIYDHAVTEPPRLSWQKTNSQLAPGAADTVETRQVHASQAATKAAAYAVALFSGTLGSVAGFLLTRLIS